MLVIIYLLEDEQELSLGMLIHPKVSIISACSMHVLCDFAMFWLNFITLLNQFGLPTNSVHPVASSWFSAFLFFRFSGRLKCPENSEKIILKISASEDSKKTRGEAGGHCQGARRVPGA